jgi:hypothetical protein
LRFKLGAFILVLLVIGLFSNLSHSSTSRAIYGFGRIASQKSTYENVTTHEGDLIINGTQTFVIENCTYIQTGNIYVTDSGKLIARHSELRMNQTGYQQYNFIVKDYANLELEDTRIVSDNGIEFDVQDYSEAQLSNTTLDLPAWSGIHFSGHSKTTMQRLTLLGVYGVQFHSQCDVTIENSVIDGVAFWSPGNCNVRFFNSSIADLQITFDRDCSINVADIKPGFYDYLDLKEKVSMISGTPFSLVLKKTRVDYWNLEFYYDSETTIQDSTISRLGIAVQGISAYLQDLRPQYYEYWQIGKITLNNTSI